MTKRHITRQYKFLKTRLLPWRTLRKPVEIKKFTDISLPNYPTGTSVKSFSIKRNLICESVHLHFCDLRYKV